MTPHPEQIACRQCHIGLTDAKLLVDIDWMSVHPPGWAGRLPARSTAADPP